MMYIEVDKIKQLHELNPSNESGDMHVVIHSDDNKPFEYAVLYSESLNSPSEIQLTHVPTGYVEFDVVLRQNQPCYLMIASSTEEVIRVNVDVNQKIKNVKASSFVLSDIGGILEPYRHTIISMFFLLVVGTCMYIASRTNKTKNQSVINRLATKLPS